MIHLYLGYKTFSRMEVPDVLHVGDNVDEGRRVVAEKLSAKGAPPYVRIGLQRGMPGVVPVQIQLPDKKAETDVAAKKAAKLKT